MSTKTRIANWYEKLGLTFKADPLTKDETYNIILSDRIQTCLPMLEWKNLPDTMESWIMNLYLQTTGYTIFAKHDGKYYNFYGGLGGEPNVYFMPTIATIANPALKWSDSLTLDKDAVLIRNDRLMEGLLPWHRLYAYQMAEAFMTLRIGLINSRSEYVLTTNDDNEKEGANRFLKNLEEGLHLGHLVNENFLNQDTLSSIPYSTGAINSIRSAVEALQYLYSSWARGIGIQSSFNTKREYVALEASTQPEESVINRPNEMLACAKEACDKINSIFGLNISVDFGSIWKTRETEIELGEKILENEANQQVNSNPQDEAKKENETNKEVNVEESKDEKE